MTREPLIGWVGLALITALVVYPLVVSSFWVVQIGAQTMILGIIALSLLLLAGYGGMVSLAQLAVAGLTGYVAAYFGIHSDVTLGIPLPWGLTVLVAITVGTLFGLLIGLVSARTEGIYMLMITLAVAIGLFYLALQNMGFFNAYSGFHGVKAPVVFDISLRQPIAFYYLCFACALGVYLLVAHVVRTPFGLALQGTRDNARRMLSLGYNVALHRVAAFALAGFIAAVGGLLKVWYAGSISPGSINVAATINILIIAILGGLAHPIGAFAGALLFVLIQNFAIDFIDRERFNTMIGLILLAIILFMPSGLMGMAQALRRRLHPPTELADEWPRAVARLGEVQGDVQKDKRLT
jgi:branched-chain amino acid transport system permease protein